MNLIFTRFDYNRRGGNAWITLLAPEPESALDGEAPTIKMTLQYAVRASQDAPANEQQIVVPHPLVRGLHVVANFYEADQMNNPNNLKTDWPPEAAYRFRAVQMLANLVACAELDRFGAAIPKIIP